MSFHELGLSEPLLRALTTEQYEIPTPIQAQGIPPVMEGRDVLGCAQTGTGKTAAFALPILHRLAANPQQGHAIRVLILAPTRELAGQIHESFRTYGRHMPLRYSVIFGGVSQHSQTQSLRAGVDVVIATPGRLLDLMEQGFVDLRRVEVLVLDEADHMLDMGFIHDIRKILVKLPARRQNLMYSATMPGEIRELADTILRNPVRVQVAAASAAADTVRQSIYFVEKRNKPVLLAHYLKNNSITRSLVFTRTKHGADRVARHLEKNGIRAQAIHGNKSQNARNRAMAEFKGGRPPVLVATDIAARGLDIDEVSHVVNYDLPNVPETYVHRIGRTGRAGASGMAVSFCDREERPYLKAIEKLTRKSIPVVEDQPAYPAGPAHGAPRTDDRPANGPRQSDSDRRHRQPHAATEHRRAQPQHRTSEKPVHRSHPVAAGAAPRSSSHSAQHGSARPHARPKPTAGAASRNNNWNRPRNRR